MIELREFRAGDEPYLRRVFESAIHDVAIRDYSQAEVDAWAPRQFDPCLWARRVQGISPLVVERDGEIVSASRSLTATSRKCVASALSMRR